MIGFDDEDEAIAAANDTEFGLVAYVYTRDIKRAFRVIERLETGMVGLNQGMVSNAAAPVRRRQGLRLRPRGRAGGDRGVPRDQVRRDGDVNPLSVVRDWYEEAVAAGLPEPDAMALATATPDGRPSVRFVLLKGHRRRRHPLLHELRSRKARELDANPRAAATLYWLPLGAPVRLEGTVERLAAAESDAYFASRARGAGSAPGPPPRAPSCATATSSSERVREVAERFPDDLPRPDHWGGYLLRPDAVELWQGRPDRLHDREHFLRAPDGVLAGRAAVALTGSLSPASTAATRAW